MKRDGLLYSLFQLVPTLFFDLMGQPSVAEDYRLAFVDGNQPDWKLDGMFLPRDRCLVETPTYYFVKARFQWDPLVYRDLFSEVFLYLEVVPSVQRWQAVVLYPSPELEVDETQALGEFLNSSHVQVIYLNQLGAISELTPGLGILRLLVEPTATVPSAARGLIERVQASAIAAVDRAQLLELIETIVVYMFPRRTREEIAVMLGITELKETRVYQEGREEEARSLISRQLTRKLGALPEGLQGQVKQLSLEALETLHLALFDFAEVSDLEAWLAAQEADESN